MEILGLRDERDPESTILVETVRSSERGRMGPQCNCD